MGEPILNLVKGSYCHKHYSLLSIYMYYVGGNGWFEGNGWFDLNTLFSSDLSKPASTLYLHNLTGILETAIRATNAQYDSSDALKRLDVRLLDLSPGDQGWDVFSLHYHVDGPIGTVRLGWA